MIKYGENGLARQLAAHAPFKVGMRVRLNETFPYGGHGRLATVIKLPRALQARYIIVRFDGSTIDVEYFKGFLDPIDAHT